MKLRNIFGVAGIVAIFPAVAYAAFPFPIMGGSCSSPLCELIREFGNIIGLLIGIVSSLALLVFIWGLVKYIWSAGSEESKGEGKKIMVWGVIALFVLFSVFGLVRFLQATFNINPNETTKTPPQVNF